MPLKSRIISLFFLSLLLPAGHAFAQLHGSYTIDSAKAATASNYKTVFAAVNDLMYGTRTDTGVSNGKGISGPVIFNIADGIYAGQFALGQIIGSSAANTIIFQSASGDSSKAILVDSASGGVASNNYLVKLNHTRYVYFRKLSFIRPGGGNVIYLASPDHIHFENCVIAENDNFSSAVSDLDLHTGYDSFVNNIIKNAGNGLKISNISGDTDSNFVIHNNIFENVVDPVYFNKQTNFSITGNTISGKFDLSSTGMYFSNLKGPALIKNNMINLQDTADLTGIYLRSINSYLGPDGPVHDKGKILLADNIVSLQDHSKTGNVIGLDIEADNFTDIVYNTVIIDSSRSAYSFPLYFDLAGDTDRILNNDFVNISGKYAAKLRNAFSVSTDTLNYNNFYSISGLMVWHPLGKDTDIDIVKSLNVIDTKDKNNISVLPLFKSVSDPHVTNFVLHAQGTPFAQVKDDIDGNPRNKTHPDIGADELHVKRDLGFKSIWFKLGTMCNGVTTYDTAIATITNAGIDTLKNIPFYYTVPGTPDTVLSFIDTAKIDPGTTDSVKIPIKLTVKDSGWYPIYVFMKIDSNANVNNYTTITFLWFITAPKPSFAYSLACVGEPVSLKINTKTYRNLNYTWNFGDGLDIAVKDTSHVFYDDSIHTIILESIDSVGCVDTIIRKIKPLPVSYSSFSYESTGASYSFTADDTGFRKYVWAFGDGDSSAALKPSHTYNHDGLYPVTLYVQDANGCYDSLVELIDIMNAGLVLQKPLEQGFSVYPDPFTDFATIQYQLPQPGAVQITLYNSMGQAVKEYVNENEGAGKYSFTIDPQAIDLKPGMYIIAFKSGLNTRFYHIDYLR